jgi:hypothetical protein
MQNFHGLPPPIMPKQCKCILNLNTSSMNPKDFRPISLIQIGTAKDAFQELWSNCYSNVCRKLIIMCMVKVTAP